MKGFVSILLLMVALVSATGATFSELFATEPSAWEVWNPDAFQWDAEAQNLAVTWDSRQTNALFYYKLPQTLTRRDNFQVEFTFRFKDIMAGIDATKNATFPVCFGFLNLSQAKRTNYFRGAGVNATTGPRSVVEFAYFPASGIIDATVGPIIASTNNQIAYSHSHPVELGSGEIFRVRMAFAAATQALSATIWRNGEMYGELPNNTIRPLTYTSSFGDFDVDAFSITTYSDAGQAPPQFAGSVLAHGIVDDVLITWPEPPVQAIEGFRKGNAWAVRFSGAPSWSYSLERTADFKNWTEVAIVSGVDGAVELMDETPPIDLAYYRVVARRS